MEYLEENVRIGKNITTALTKVIQAFHKLVLGDTGDRKNRSRLRNFNDFTFQSRGGEYYDKVAFIQEAFTKRDLIAICNILCLDYGGSKEDLAKRICSGLIDFNMLCQNDNDPDDDADEDTGDKSDDVATDGINREDAYGVRNGVRDGVRDAESHADRNKLRQPEKARRDQTRRHNFSLTFRDIKGSIRSFDGSDAYPVERWITDFEDTATLFQWNEMQQLIFAKRLLTGLAKLYIQSKGVVKNWKTLKAMLRDKFSTKIDSALLHQMLSKRVMKENEKLQEYYLVMKELAARGTIEEEALIRHIIHDISDDERNKVVLYGTKKLRDFKERLRAYEEIREAN